MNQEDQSSTRDGAPDGIERTVFDYVLEYLAAALLLALMIIALTQVASRYTATFGAPWTEELGRFVFTGLVWLSAILVTRRARHIRFELIEKQFPDRARILLRVVLGFLGLGFWAVVVFYGWRVVESTAASTYITLPWLSIKYSYLAAVVAGGVIFLLLAREVAGNIARLRAKAS